MTTMPTQRLSAQKTEALLDKALLLGDHAFQVTTQALKAFDSHLSRCIPQTAPVFDKAAEASGQQLFSFMH